MEIAICGSMVFSSEMIKVGEDLRKLGHRVTLPEFVDHYSTLASRGIIQLESAQNKIKHGLIRHYFEKIKQSDGILVYNQSKRGIENYVGGNTLIEMAFAHILHKKVFMYNPIPNMPYRDEIQAINPDILNRDLRKIK